MAGKRLQVHLDEDDTSSLGALAETTGLPESDIVRAALKLAEEIGLGGDAELLVPLASPDWPWPDWWAPLCSELQRRKDSNEPVRTATGVDNEIIEVNPTAGYVRLMSTRSRSGMPRNISVGMLKNAESATSHGVIVRVLRDLADSTAVKAASTGWHGSFRVASLLAAAMDDEHDWPPDQLGVYLVSEKPWKGKPKKGCKPLYVGSTTGRSARFCTRVGDLLIDMYGFFGDWTGHHSGGQNIWRWCRDNNVHPGDLYIGWYTADGMCPQCEETRWYDILEPVLNRKRPPRCKKTHQ